MNCKVAGHTYYGAASSKEFTGRNKEIMFFHFRDFMNIPAKTIATGAVETMSIKACGHPWTLQCISSHSVYVVFRLKYDGDNSDTDPVLAKAKYIKRKIHATNEVDEEIPEYKYSKKKPSGGLAITFLRANFRTQVRLDDITGMVTIPIEIEVATEKKKAVWYPQLPVSSPCGMIGSKLYDSVETSDVTFVVGALKEKYSAHKCILSVVAQGVYAFIVTEEEEGRDNESSTEIILEDVDGIPFEVLLKFLYTGTLDTNLMDGLYDSDTIKSILVVAEKFDVPELKLYMESIVLDTYLAPSTAVELFLFSDSHCCALLKESAMNMFVDNSQSVMDSTSKEEWHKLQESSKLLTELLVYATSDRKQYSSASNVIITGNTYTPLLVSEEDNNDDDDGDINDPNELDVQSLRERLEKFDLDVDGSRTMLVERWKNYLQTNTQSTTTVATGAASSVTTTNIHYENALKNSYIYYYDHSIMS